MQEAARAISNLQAESDGVDLATLLREVPREAYAFQQLGVRPLTLLSVRARRPRGADATTRATARGAFPIRESRVPRHDDVHSTRPLPLTRSASVSSTTRPLGRSVVARFLCSSSLSLLSRSGPRRSRP